MNKKEQISKLTQELKDVLDGITLQDLNTPTTKEEIINQLGNLYSCIADYLNLMLVKVSPVEFTVRENKAHWTGVAVSIRRLLVDNPKGLSIDDLSSILQVPKDRVESSIESMRRYKSSNFTIERDNVLSVFKIIIPNKDDVKGGQEGNGV